MSGQRRNRDCLWLQVLEPLEDGRIGLVDLVQDNQLGDLTGLDVGQDTMNGLELALGIGVGSIDQVHQQGRILHLVECRTKSLDQMVGEAADESRPCRTRECSVRSGGGTCEPSSRG